MPHRRAAADVRRRAQNVDQSILPALAAGQIVLCDRFTDSTLVYQGAGAASAPMPSTKWIASLRRPSPDLTFYLDIDPETGLARARRRNASDAANPETRLDDQDLEFHRRVREAYLQLARTEPARIRIVDASAPPDAVASAIWTHTLERLTSHRLHH